MNPTTNYIIETASVTPSNTLAMEPAQKVVLVLTADELHTLVEYGPYMLVPLEDEDFYQQIIIDTLGQVFTKLRVKNVCPNKRNRFTFTNAQGRCLLAAIDKNSAHIQEPFTIAVFEEVKNQIFKQLA